MRSKLVFLFAFLVGMMCTPGYGQWTNVRKPNVSAPVPRMADGHPDLSGVWESGGPKYIENIAADLKPGDVPFQPWAAALVAERADGSHSGEDPPAQCLPRGVPRINASPPPWRIIQRPEIVGILYESDNTWRQIFLDNRELEKDAPPAYLGYSTGKWDGDTLVVDTRGFNGRTWLDQTGKPTSEALHVTERFRRTDFGHMEVVITIDDPKVYTKPWTVTEHPRLVTNGEIFESPCENNRDLPHLSGKIK